MLKLVVVDDEPGAHDVLGALLQQEQCPARIVGQAYSALEGVRTIQRTRPDVVLLDIEMPQGTGFDLLDAFPDRWFDVVYTTAHRTHALRAIRTRPMDYLLKPIDPDDLVRVLRQIEQQRNGAHDVLEIGSAKGRTYVRMDELVHVEADGGYSHLHLANGERITASRPIGHFEERLPKDRFFRCHHSHLVNLHMVKAYQNRDGGVLAMHHGREVPLASRKHAEFEARMNTRR